MARRTTRTLEVRIRAVEAKLTAFDKVQKKSKEARTSVKGLAKAGSALKGVFAGLTFGAAIAGLNRAAAAALEFERGIAKISTLIPGQSRQLKGLEGSVNDLSAAYGIAASDAAEGMFQAMSAGVNASEVTEFMGTAAMAAKAGFSSMAETVSGLTTVINAYGLETSEASGIADAMFTANKLGVTTTRELSSSLGAIVGMSSKVGVSYRDLMAATVALTKGGVSTAESMTGMRAIIASLVGPSKDAAAAAKEMGVRWDIGLLQSEGMSGAVRVLGEVLNTHGVEAINKLIPRVDGVAKALTLAGDTGAADFTKALKEMTTKAGQANEAFAAVARTVGMRLDKANERTAKSMRTVGRAAAEGKAELAGFWAPMLEGAIDVVFANTQTNASIGALGDEADLTFSRMHRLGLGMKDGTAEQVAARKAVAKLAIELASTTAGFDKLGEASNPLEGFVDQTLASIHNVDDLQGALAAAEQRLRGVEAAAKDAGAALETGMSGGAEGLFPSAASKTARGLHFAAKAKAAGKGPWSKDKGKGKGKGKARAVTTMSAAASEQVRAQLALIDLELGGLAKAGEASASGLEPMIAAQQKVAAALPLTVAALAQGNEVGQEQIETLIGHAKAAGQDETAILAQLEAARAAGDAYTKRAEAATAARKAHEELVATLGRALATDGLAGLEAALDRVAGLSDTARAKLAELAAESQGSSLAMIGTTDALKSSWDDAFSGLANGLGASLEAFASGESGFGSAMERMTAAVLLNVGRQAATKSIFELAEGIAAAASGNMAGAGGHFAAAGVYASIAGGAMAVGGSMQRGINASDKRKEESKKRDKERERERASIADRRGRGEIGGPSSAQSVVNIHVAGAHLTQREAGAAGARAAAAATRARMTQNPEQEVMM